MLILISCARSIYSMVTLSNINQVFESTMNYFGFAAICNLTINNIYKYHYCNKLTACTSYVTVIQRDFSNTQENIIQRIIISHKTSCSLNSNFKPLVILIVIGGKNYKDEELTNGNINIFNVGKESDSIKLYVLLFILFQNVVLIIIIPSLNSFHVILKDIRFATVFLNVNITLFKGLTQNIQVVDDSINKYIWFIVADCWCNGWIRTSQIVSGKRLILCYELIFGKENHRMGINYELQEQKSTNKKSRVQNKRKEKNKRNCFNRSNGRPRDTKTNKFIIQIHHGRADAININHESHCHGYSYLDWNKQNT